MQKTRQLLHLLFLAPACGKTIQNIQSKDKFVRNINKSNYSHKTDTQNTGYRLHKKFITKNMTVMFENKYGKVFATSVFT